MIGKKYMYDKSSCVGKSTFYFNKDVFLLLYCILVSVDDNDVVNDVIMGIQRDLFTNILDSLVESKLYKL